MVKYNYKIIWNWHILCFCKTENDQTYLGLQLMLVQDIVTCASSTAAVVSKKKKAAANTRTKKPTSVVN